MVDSRLFLRIAVILCALAILCTSIFLGWNAWTIQKLDSAKTRFAAAGLPTSIADLVTTSVPEAENAAPLIKQIAEITTRADSAEGIAEKLKRAARQTGATGTDTVALNEAREILARPPGMQILALAREAADRPGFDAKLDFSLGAKLPILHVGPLRTAADALRLQTRLSIEAGAEDEAARDIWRLLNLADFLAREPILISQLLRIVLLDWVVEELSYAVAGNTLSEAWAVHFSERLAKIDLKAAVQLSLDGERIVCGESIFAEMISGKIGLGGVLIDPDGTGKKSPWSYIPKGWWRLEYASYLTHFETYRGVVLTNWSRPVEQYRQMNALFLAIPHYQTLARTVLPNVSTVVWKVVDAQIRIDAVEAGLSAYRHRLRHGSFPASLAELVPEFLSSVPLDNYSGAAMIYRRQQSSFVLYSIGRNGRDDEGRFAVSEADDLGFSPALSLQSLAHR